MMALMLSAGVELGGPGPVVNFVGSHRRLRLFRTYFVASRSMALSEGVSSFVVHRIVQSFDDFHLSAGVVVAADCFGHCCRRLHSKHSFVLDDSPSSQRA